MEKLFSKSHEWVKIEGSKAQIGLSDYAQQELCLLYTSPSPRD